MRVYKILATADIHMSNKLSYAKPTENGLTDRFQDQLHWWDAFTLLCRDESPDAVLILGDLFDKSLVDAVTLSHTIDVIVNLPCDVFILPGNHDASSSIGGRYVVEAFGSMKKDHIFYLDKPEKGNAIFLPRPSDDWLRLYPVPYSSPEYAQQRIEECQKEIAEKSRRGKDILLLHHSIIGCEHLGWKCDQGLDGELICEGFDAVWSGHFHRSQRFGPGNGLYLGAPMHHDFGDVGRPTPIWNMIVSPDKIIEEPLEMKWTPKFHLTKLDLDTSSWSGEDISEGSHRKGDYWRYEVTGTYDQWNEFKPRMKEQLEEMSKQGLKCSFKHKPIRAHSERLVEEKEEIITLEGQIKKYVDVVWTGDSKMKGKVLEYGLNLLKEAKDDS